MKKYEAMFIVKCELSEEERKALFNFIGETITKNGGTLTNSTIFADKRKLYFPIKKHNEGLYYLVNFTIDTQMIVKIRHAYSLNENILRVLFTAL